MHLTHSVVSLGGVAVGLSLLTWIGVRWWKRDRPNWKPLLPFLTHAVYGMLAILSAGGLLGGLAGFALWGSNTIGGLALTYGVGGNNPQATRAQALILTDGGHALVLVLTVGIIAALRFSKKLHKRDAVLGILCGICLGLSSGIAGAAAAALVPAVDWAGGTIAGLL